MDANRAQGNDGVPPTADAIARPIRFTPSAVE